jgi:hypothetical protein
VISHRTTLADERQAARALVGGLGAEDRVGDGRDVVVLHVLADAAQLVHDQHADMPEMIGIADPGQLQDVRRADRTRRQDRLARRLDPLHGAAAREFASHCLSIITVSLPFAGERDKDEET